MVDIVIEPNAVIDNFRRSYSRYVVGVDQDTHYTLFVDSLGALAIRKSDDGGVSWGLPVIVHLGLISKFSVWYEPWTPGDFGTLIHIVVLDATGNSLSYYNFNVSSDALSGEVEIDTPTVVASTLYNANQVAIAKARGGNLLIQYWGDAIGSRGCWRSIDNGASWAARTDGADGNLVDFVMMFPGNETDDQDMWMLYLDVSVNALSLKTYDDDANSWSESAIVGGITESTQFWQIAGAMRHSDNHLLIAIWTIVDAPTADILTFDVAGGASITPTANVVTDQDESGSVCLTIDQQSGDVYVGYNKGGTWLSSVDSVYHKSEDGMSTWGAEQAMSENASDDYRNVSSTLSIGDVGGKFLPVWENEDLNDLLCNVNNAVSIDPAPPPPPPASVTLPEYGQLRTAIGDPPVYGATILRS